MKEAEAALRKLVNENPTITYIHVPGDLFDSITGESPESSLYRLNNFMRKGVNLYYNHDLKPFTVNVHFSDGSFQTVNLADTSEEDEYEPLRRVLDEVYAHAAHGKGRLRHGRHGERFQDQPIIGIQHQVGPGFTLGQAMKKIGEAAGVLKLDEGFAEKPSKEDWERAKGDLLGAGVYIAGAILFLEEALGE